MKPLFNLFIIFSCILLFACDPSKDKIEKEIELMKSAQICIPFDKMQICKKDSSFSDSCLWKNAKLKLIHYIDSSQCTSCYMKKIEEKYNELYRLEKDTMRIPVDTRSPIPVISVQSVGDLQYRRQS